MTQAENLDRIAPEKYGIRKAKSVDTQSLNTRLFYDLIRQKRILETSILADLLSNYNLVVHSIASLTLQRVDVPKETILCNFTTLQNMTHSVRIAFGDSKTTYGGDTWALPVNPPHQFLVQGNGAAREIWDIVSTLMLKCLRKSGHGAAFKCCISGNTKRLVGYCFVNNSTIVHMYPLTNKPT